MTKAIQPWLPFDDDRLPKETVYVPEESFEKFKNHIEDDKYIKNKELKEFFRGMWKQVLSIHKYE